MKKALILAIVLLIALAMSVNAQNTFPVNAQNYRVTAFKKNQPQVQSTSNYARVTPGAILYIPNAFTPNGDGINETFVPKGDGIETFKMLIYNRWGELLYETTDLQQGWDGTYQGVLSQQDVYIYKVSARGLAYGIVEQEGTVTLIN
ncbi:MAG: gliding motility-associated C-terminal domain-containing protein [Sphingobacteriales bacterium JAD_PAG50586_3]|nr:MAG: gliding motility-associated C-terminal domain-containing protein [Sphingobacteriales bacterium JAD_PAG50586_3]